MATNSQLSQIREYLCSGGTLSPLDALRLFRCMRLAARIADLRQEGWIIDTVTTTSEDDPRVSFASYRLDSNKNYHRLRKTGRLSTM